MFLYKNLPVNPRPAQTGPGSPRTVLGIKFVSGRAPSYVQDLMLNTLPHFGFIVDVFVSYIMF